LITIVTPTYNRVDQLSNLCRSLKLQTKKDFTWHVYDDGSTDGTSEYVRELIAEKELNIQYFFSQNCGKHKIINRFIKNVETELIFVVDSDDVLSNDAIEQIIHDWNSYNNKNIIGISYLRSRINGDNIGDFFPGDYLISSYLNVRFIERVKGDKAEVWKTSEFKKNPFLEFNNERFFSEQHKYILLSESGQMLFINKSIYICEYLPDGLSNKIRKLQYENPNGTIANALILSRQYFPLIVRLKSFLKLCAYSHLTDESFLNRFQKSEFGYQWLVFTPIGILYKFWIKLQYYLMINR
jgi:glycosyltransferase involved in cell wall biosynthesis